jgi:hypothetical protein
MSLFALYSFFFVRYLHLLFHGTQAFHYLRYLKDIQSFLHDKVVFSAPVLKIASFVVNDFQTSRHLAQ